MNTKYIFLDVDGTLIDNYIPDVPTSAKEAIAKAKANGHKIFISSGRSYRDIEQKIKVLNPDGYVLGVGSHIICEDKTISKLTLPTQLAISTFQYLLDNGIGFKIDCVDSIHAFGSSQDFVKDTDRAMGIDVESDSYNDYLSNRHFYFDDSIDDIIKHNEYDYLKITTFDKDKEKMAKVLEKLPSDFSYYISKLTTNDTYFSEIKDINVHKDTGIKCVLDYYHADQKDTISIGDSINDLEMIEYTNIGICMGNGCKELKEKADYVTTSVGEDGIYKAFKHYNLI